MRAFRILSFRSCSEEVETKGIFRRSIIALSWVRTLRAWYNDRAETKFVHAQVFSSISVQSYYDHTRKIRCWTLTFKESIVDVQKGEMVTVGNVESSFCCVCRSSCRHGSNPDRRNYIVGLYKVVHIFARLNNLPESIDTMVKISSLHLNSALTISVLAIWTML